MPQTGGLTPKQRSDPFWMAAMRMAIVHNAIIRGLNAIILQAPYVAVYQGEDFIGYARSWFEFVHDHHLAEEELLFPTIEKAIGICGIMEENVEQHQAFETGLKLFDEYLSTATGTTFNGLKLNSIIDSFAPCLINHLGDEISSIMGLARFDAQIDMAAISQDVAAKAVGRLSKDTVLPFFVTALDKTIDERDFAEFPPIPSIEGMFSRSYWKFAPCSVDRVPKEKPEVTA